MASFTETSLLQLLVNQVIPHSDSLGMNEQELPNILGEMSYSIGSFSSKSTSDITRSQGNALGLRVVLHHFSSSAALRGEPVKLVADSNPRVAAALDDIRALFTAADRLKGVRRLTRIHVHTLAFQAIVTVKGEKHVGVTPPGVTSFICIIFVSRLWLEEHYVCCCEGITGSQSSCLWK